LQAPNCKRQQSPWLSTSSAICRHQPTGDTNLFNRSIISNFIFPSSLHLHKKVVMSLLSQYIPSVHSILDFRGSLDLAPPSHPYTITLSSFHFLTSLDLIDSLHTIYTHSLIFFLHTQNILRKWYLYIPFFHGFLHIKNMSMGSTPNLLKIKLHHSL